MALKRFDEEFELKPGTQLLPYMKRLLPSLEGRFQSLEGTADAYSKVMDDIRASALMRMNEILIPATADIIEVTSSASCSRLHRRRSRCLSAFTTSTLTRERSVTASRRRHTCWSSEKPISTTTPSPASWTTCRRTVNWCCRSPRSTATRPAYRLGDLLDAGHGGFDQALPRRGRANACHCRHRCGAGGRRQN